MLKSDLHCHTDCSDGSSGIEEVFSICRSLGIDTLAVSDHDTFAGADLAAASEHRGDVTLVYAVEFSCFDYKRGNKVHILCYFPKETEALEAICRETTQNRREAGELMLGNVMRLYPIRSDDVYKYAAKTGCIYKQHLMRTLMDYAYTDRIYGELYHELFHPREGSCFVPMKYPDVHEVLDCIRDSGGISVMAHPGTYHGIDLMEELAKSRAVDGIELWHSRNSEHDRKRIREAAQHADLIVTGGSDFHGMHNSNRCPIGAYHTPDEQLYRLFQKAGI